MNGLMLRRQAMMARKPVETWDFEWDYTMGKLEEQTGWSVDKTGTYGSSLISGGEKIYTGSTSYYQPYMLSDGIYADLRRFDTNGYGAVEVVFYGVFNSTGHNLRITAAASATKRITLLQAGGKWRVGDNQVTNQCSVITNAPNVTNNTEYTVRINFKDTTADVYINGTLVGADIDTSVTVLGTTNHVMHQNGGGSSYYAVIKSLKIKKGRIN